MLRRDSLTPPLLVASLLVLVFQTKSTSLLHQEKDQGKFVEIVVPLLRMGS